jgi:O-antigen/teichoic acid export membrane protein
MAVINPSAFRKNRFYTGALVMFAGQMVANIGSYLYHLFMGRMLGPAAYGLLAAVIALIYLLLVPTLALNWALVKFVAQYQGEKKPKMIKKFFLEVNQRGTVVGSLAFGLFLVLTPFLASFLHLDSNWPLFLAGATAFFTLLATIARAFLQGISVFTWLALIHSLVAVFLVFLGFQVNGALLAGLVGILVALFLARYPLRQFFGVGLNSEEINWPEIVSFFLPVLFSIFSFTSLYTTDTILARHFLSPKEAGFYAALAIMGKIIYFASYPVVMVMFPLVSEKLAEKGKPRLLLGKSLALVGAICFFLIMAYFLFPSFLIKILFGSDFLPAARYLSTFAVFLSFYSLSFLLTQFFLSVNRTKIVFWPVLAALGQILLIIGFHSNLGQIVKVNLLVTGFLLGTEMLWLILERDLLFSEPH